ncbi:hypothetical protein MBLNU459_g7501t1 [Dothideomycetes sp. NU459]
MASLETQKHMGLPKTMKALQYVDQITNVKKPSIDSKNRYSKPREFAVVEIPVPSIGLNDVLLTIASRPGPKLDLAQQLEVADSYISLSETEPEVQLQALKDAHPYGFDIVVEATGWHQVLEESINFVRKGGKLVAYGFYGDHVKVSWSPSLIWTNEITILASFCETLMFPVAVDYLESKRVRVEGIAHAVYRIEQWTECLEAMRRQEVVKAVIVFD